MKSYPFMICVNRRLNLLERFAEVISSCAALEKIASTNFFFVLLKEKFLGDTINPLIVDIGNKYWKDPFAVLECVCDLYCMVRKRPNLG